MSFDAGDPVTRENDPRGPLLEDEDGALLPHELQRGGRIHETVLGWLTDPDMPIARYEVDEWPNRTTDDLMGRLAPVLWPILPSNDSRDRS